MSLIKVGHYESDGETIYLPLGFIPDWFHLVDISVGASHVIIYEWFERMQDDQATGSQEGWSITEGTTALLADAGGITAYDTGAQIPTITTWTQAVGNAATARSATAHGTYVRPSVASAMDRDAIFECVTDGNSAATEPTWPKEIGGQVTDGTTVWERVNVALKRGGYQGVTIAGGIQTDAREYYFLAVQADVISADFGDVDGWTGGVQGA